MSEHPPKRFKIHVLGCKVNQYEACQIEQVLRVAGLIKAHGNQVADLVVVHGCAVTAVAARKSRQTVRKLRQSNPGALMVMTGCGGDSRVFDPAAEQCEVVHPGEHLLRDLERVVAPLVRVDNLSGSADRYIVDGFSGRTRAFLKIQDGCNIGCTYCIVPSLRGASRDKPLQVILQEAETLVRNGYLELVVAGVSVGLYGRQSKVSLARVLRELLAIDGLERLRMSSLHPQEISDELLEVWASTPRMMPHVHLPLQSGSAALLDRMQRGYTPEMYLNAIDRFRKVLDCPAFTTDVIVGFPGEAPEDFRDTIRIAEQACFSKMHIFPYSQRPGTKAIHFADPVPGETAKQRAAELQELAAHLAQQYFSLFIGREEHVLVERVTNEGLCEGRGIHYFPVRFPGTSEWVGKVVPVNIESVTAEYARGVMSALGHRERTI